MTCAINGPVEIYRDVPPENLQGFVNALYIDRDPATFYVSLFVVDRVVWVVVHRVRKVVDDAAEGR